MTEYKKENLLNFTTPQKILIYLSDNDSYATEIAEKIDADRSTISTLLNKLEDIGMVKRRSEKNAFKVFYSATEEGLKFGESLKLAKDELKEDIP